MAKVMKRSIVIAGHKTSVSLEDEFWLALKEIAVRDRVRVSALIVRIDGQRNGNLSSAIRTFILDHYRTRTTGDGVPARPPRQDVALAGGSPL
jgi:predicted DNA-binding ribbon-helix-helix protein